MKAKTPAESFTRMTELVLPNDTNTLGNLMGGRLLHWMDIVAAIVAQRHSNRVCVTVAVDFVNFQSGIRLGEIVILEARLTRVFTTSMEIRIDVYAENMISSEKRKSNEAYYSFVAVDQLGRPIPVNPVQPSSPEEEEAYEQAQRRRELRLLLAGRMKPEDATLVKLIEP